MASTMQTAFGAPVASAGAPTNPNAPQFGIGGLGGAGTSTLGSAPTLTGSAWSDAGGQGALDVQADIAQRQAVRKQQLASASLAGSAAPSQQMYIPGGVNG